MSKTRVTEGVDYKQMASGNGRNNARKSAKAKVEQELAKDSSECGNCKLLAETVTNLVEEVRGLKETIKVLQDKADVEPQASVAAEVNELKKSVEALQQKEDSQPQTPTSNLEQWMTDIEERIESRTNRQLRQTLVFRHIPENKEAEKNWDDTTNIIAGKIASLCDVSAVEAKAMINRCHRGGNPKHYDARKQKFRPIYANLFSWQNCEKILLNARSPDSHVYVDYKYGPMTTERRNLAMAKRKELKKDGTLTKAFVKFPAVLMGIPRGEERYREIENFSTTKVDISKRGRRSDV